MSIFRNSNIGSFTRGGQTTLHYIRMVLQVLKQFILTIGIGLLILFTVILYVKTTSYQRSVAIDYGLAHASVKLGNKPDHKMIFTLEGGRKVNIAPKAIILNEGVKDVMSEFYREVSYSLVICILLALGILIWGARFITITGEDQADEEYLRGGTLVSSKELADTVKKTDPLGTISIGGVRLPAASEPAGVMLCGGPGTGKSQIILNLLSEIREAGQRAVIYDVAGSFIEAFYDPSRDVILNPLDKRSKTWNIWADADSVWEYDGIAESLIPDSAMGSDPMWALASRKVLVEVAKQLKRDGKTTNKDLTDAILRFPKEALMDMLQKTEAASILDKDATKTVASIRLTLSSFVQSMSYLHDASEPFSFRDWVRDEDQAGWIFVSTKADQKAAIKPLITCWIDIAASAILSLTPRHDRRIWLSIDELPTLNRLPSLLNTMTNARKYGGCTIIGFQNYPQMCEIYKADGADAIAEACSTWAILRANGEKTAEWASKGLGKTEVNETTEGLSYGAHEIRDGVNLTKTRKIREIVMSTELTNLRDLNGFIRLGRSYPVAHFILKYTKYKDVAPEFILRPGAGDIDRNFNPESLEERAEPKEQESYSAFGRNEGFDYEEESGSALISFESSPVSAESEGQSDTPDASRGAAPQQSEQLAKVSEAESKTDAITTL